MTDQTLIDFLRESNAIEGVYDDVSLQDALKAWKYLIKHDRLTPTIVKTTHRLLMVLQPIPRGLKGAYRDCEIEIGGRMGLTYPLVPLRVKEWCIQMNTSWVANKANNDQDIIRDHITYERIHPFIDGNGRTGRMFYNWQRIQCGLPIHVIWEKEKQFYYRWF